MSSPRTWCCERCKKVVPALFGAKGLERLESACWECALKKCKGTGTGTTPYQIVPNVKRRKR